MAKLGKGECFEYFGVKTKNSRWSWSARNEETKKVVLTFWKDFFDYDAKPPRYVDRGWGETEDTEKLGNKERVENIKWALKNCGGQVRAVIAVAVDKNANPRTIKNSYPAKQFGMQITSFDEVTGEFEAVQVPNSDLKLQSKTT